MTVSKFDFFSHNRDAAREVFNQDSEVFGDNQPLLLELRRIFDWIAEERGALRIASRKFKQRLPEIHKKFPMLASNFARADLNSDCWLEWEEFCSFCLDDVRLMQQMKRSSAIQVYSIDHLGQRVYKDASDPEHGCEMSGATPLLPWEVAHVVEWRIEGLSYRSKLPVTYHGRQIAPGAYVSSPTFAAGGVKGYLRFWPAGYWTESQTWKRASVTAITTKSEFGMPSQEMPGAYAWCCVGANLQPGAHLKFRFYVLDSKSEKRECYWSKGVSAAQVWSPSEKSPPAEIVDQEEPGYITVGLEILRNRGAPHGKPTIKKLPDAAGRIAIRPKMRSKADEKACPMNSIFLNASSSVPSIHSVPNAEERKLIRPSSQGSLQRPSSQGSTRRPTQSQEECKLKRPSSQSCLQRPSQGDVARSLSRGLSSYEDGSRRNSQVQLKRQISESTIKQPISSSIKSGSSIPREKRASFSSSASLAGSEKSVGLAWAGF
eukprot:TRINITY_DN12315_c0_g3_i1.p1 TRINITY_DN12315_c0_g3~~TRINITY_DN12315_c0_g3_i1.p1  ORF type:complete len:489 (-),score=57.05 TRINITY_DN12315_c0_g3_i1:93-1559(-)